METPGSDGRRLYRRLTIALLALTGAYVWYVTVQYGRLNDLNQRELANASAELKRTIQNSLETVHQLKRSMADGAKRSLRPGAAQAATGEPSRLCTFDEDQPYVSIRSTECKGVTGIKDISLKATSPLHIEIGVVRDAAATRDNLPDTVSLTIDTGAVLRELSFPDSFGLIFIATNKGSVLYQDAPNRRRWLRHLRWAEQQYRDAGADTFGGLTIDELNTVFGDDATNGWARLQAMSARTSTRLGGVLHEIYLEPLILENGEKVALTLGGAVPTEMLVRQALAVDSYFLAGLVFLLLLFLFGFPFIKLVSLDARERYTRGDVMRLYLSTAALLALFTFATQAIDGYVRWKAAADDGLKGLGLQLSQAFLREVGDVQMALIHADADISRQSAEELDDLPLVTDWYGLGGKDARLPLPTLPVHLEQIAWIDPDGQQIWKATSNRAAGRTAVPGRVYFRAVRDGQLYRREGENKPFYVGAEKSITDGKFYTFVSMPSKVHGEKGRGYVAVATARLLSLDRVPLPAGYGFAVVNREGRVLYHSDPRLSLRENLFDELGQGERLRSILYSGGDATHADRDSTMTSAYRERPHRLAVQRIALARDGGSAGLYVVTFRDTSLERAVAARVFLIALLGPMLLLLAFIGLALLTVALVPFNDKKQWSAWLWPHGGLVPLYKKVSALLTFLLIVGFIGWQWGQSELVFVALPLMAMTTAITIYAQEMKRAPGRKPLTSTHWFVLTFALLLIATVVVPASALFRTAMAHELGKVIATENKWMAVQRVDFQHRALAPIVAEAWTPVATARIASVYAAVANLPVPPVAPFDAPLGAEDAKMDWLLGPFHWADRFLPVESHLAARERYEPAETPYVSSGLMSYRGALLLLVTLGLLAWWLRWEARHLFLAHLAAAEPSTEPHEARWTACSPEEQCVLLQIARDRIANPHQGLLLSGLLARGLLTFDPELRPSPESFAAYVLERRGLKADQDALRGFEECDSDHSWRYIRLAVVSSAVGLGLFLVATQPGLQSAAVGITTALTGGLTALVKLRDALASWIGERAKS